MACLAMETVIRPPPPNRTAFQQTVPKNRNVDRQTRVYTTRLVTPFCSLNTDSLHSFIGFCVYFDYFHTTLRKFKLHISTEDMHLINLTFFFF